MNRKTKLGSAGPSRARTWMSVLFVMLFLMAAPLSPAFAGEETPDMTLAQADATGGGAENNPPPAESWISNGSDLGKWWLGRAKDFDPVRPELLYHVDLNYAYYKKTGNEKDEQHSLTTSLRLRKGLLNSLTAYEWLDKDYHSSRKGKEKQRFSEYLFYEMWDRVDLSVGYEWYTYNRTYVDSRHTWNAGLYFTLLDEPKYKLKLGTYYGYCDMAYMNGDIRTDMSPFMEEAAIPQYDKLYSDVVLLTQKFYLDITDNVSFTEAAAYRTYFEDTDLYHWAVKMNLNVGITKNLSFFVSYEIDYDANMGDALLNKEERDTFLNSGLQISF